MSKEKKIWQLENDKIYRLRWDNKLEATLYKVWEGHMFYYCNCAQDWIELDDGYGVYIEV